jgi:hypothetical protein
VSGASDASDGSYALMRLTRLKGAVMEWVRSPLTREIAVYALGLFDRLAKLHERDPESAFALVRLIDGAFSNAFSRVDSGIRALVEIERELEAKRTA